MPGCHQPQSSTQSEYVYVPFVKFKPMKRENNQTLPTLHTHEEAVLWFISRLDWEMVSDLLDEDRTYQDFPKWEFINKLRNVFEKFTSQGDTHLLIFPGRCNGYSCCNFKTGGYIFYGNRTKDYFNLIFELDDNQYVTDMYQCFKFKTTLEPKFASGRPIFINDFIEPF